jgi:hypothetical protein
MVDGRSRDIFKKKLMRHLCKLQQAVALYKGALLEIGFVSSIKCYEDWQGIIVCIKDMVGC